MENEDLLVIEAREKALGGGWSILDAACPNITNYRKVIVDATCLPDLFRDGTTAEATVRQLARIGLVLNEVLRAGGQVVMLLPSAEQRHLSYTITDQSGLSGQTAGVNLVDLVPGPLVYRYQPGLKVASCESRLENYFRAVKTVDGKMESGNPQLVVHTLASGVLGQKIAIEIVIDRGAIIYLPPYKGSVSDAIDVVARDLLGTPRESIHWPEWISSVPFQPVQVASRGLEQAEGELATATRRVEEASLHYERAREPLAVLIESGLRLQKRCEELFHGVGISTSPVRPDVSDEFMLDGGPKPILVEVKGLEGPAKKSHLAQLIADAASWEELENREVVPLVLVNAYRHLPLEQRGAGGNEAFSQWVQENAPRQGVVLMTTWDLLEIYYAAQSAPNIAQQLLEAICQSTGRLEVSKLLPSATTAMG